MLSTRFYCLKIDHLIKRMVLPKQDLDNKPIQGRPSRLQQSQLEQLSEFIKRTNTELQGGRLTGEDIVHYISTEFGVHYHLNHTL